MIEIVVGLVVVGVFAVLVTRRVRTSKGWSATVTPLASIIGSGFLVSVPLLASAIGIWAVAAVAHYLVLLATFGLEFIGWDDPRSGHCDDADRRDLPRSAPARPERHRAVGGITRWRQSLRDRGSAGCPGDFRHDPAVRFLMDRHLGR